MRILVNLSLAFAALLPALLIKAQDLDFPDYRNKRDNFAKINDKDARADQASFALAGVDESIGKAVLKTIPIKDYGPNFMTFENDDIKVTVKTGVFFPTKHKLMFSEKHLVKIDGKPYYGGNYGEQPHTTIESITVIIGKDTVPVPATAYFDLYDPKFSFNESGSTRTRNAVYISTDKHTYYIYMLNVDNGGSEFTWIIRDKQYLRRVVDWSFLK